MNSIEILLVDDHLDSRRVLAILLRRAGYLVAEAGSVREAIAKVNGQAFALLDFHLPDGDGTTILKHIRQQSNVMRVAFITAMHDPFPSLQKLGFEPDAVFSKPFSFTLLLVWMEHCQQTGHAIEHFSESNE